MMILWFYDLDRNICVCSQAEAVEKSSLRKCISNSSQEKLQVSTSFLQASLRRQRNAVPVETVNRSEEQLNGKQTACAWGYKQAVPLLPCASEDEVWHRLASWQHCWARLLCSVAVQWKNWGSQNVSIMETPPEALHFIFNLRYPDSIVCMLNCDMNQRQLMKLFVNACLK